MVKRIEEETQASLDASASEAYSLFREDVSKDLRGQMEGLLADLENGDAEVEEFSIVDDGSGAEVFTLGPRKPRKNKITLTIRRRDGAEFEFSYRK